MRARQLIGVVSLALVAIGGLAAQRGYFGDESKFLPKNPDKEYSFARLIYQGQNAGYRRGSSWRTDYPKADFQFMMGVKRLSQVEAHEAPVIMSLNDPRVFQYPFLYAVEVGYLYFSDEEAAVL